MTATEPSSIRLRAARPEDAGRVAELHADSWRRHYRGAYADAYLDGDILSERTAVWTERFAAPEGTATILAEDGGELAGFTHTFLDHDPQWGSLIDNLHVRHTQQRSGIGRILVAEACGIIAERASRPAMYLWVLEQNSRAQGFYRAIGGTAVERALVPPPGGIPERLNGNPGCIRFSWPDGVVADAPPQV
ncbi:GNAT family N-acetyltransferase [Microlunatus speluncae]|uniref:GNAT family N-acetyltransferase n=1 Tax=Microlunatus speluncae TaxID=2594267 RepID=UPI001C2D07B6|nr:GNAT family N-acetyltransferase [Microlunatus speluncae]